MDKSQIDKSQDARLRVTKTIVCEAALKIVEEKGVLTISYAEISKQTGISRSTLYRHWAKLEDLINEAFLYAATSSQFEKKCPPHFRDQIRWILNMLATALNDTRWGKVIPHLVAEAAVSEPARKLLSKFINDRFDFVKKIIDDAIASKEIPADTKISQLTELMISIPYFRKLITNEPLDQEWLEDHVDFIYKVVKSNNSDNL